MAATRKSRDVDDGLDKPTSVAIRPGHGKNREVYTVNFSIAMGTPIGAGPALVALTLFATIGAFLCYNFALSRIPTARAAVCINAIPLITTFGAWLLLDERLTALQGIGGLVVLGAVYLANYSPEREEHEQSVKIGQEI